MNALTTAQNTAVTAHDDLDVFAEYAAAFGGNRIVGQLLKFVKGDFMVGKNGDVMEMGSQLAANMSELLVGWIKWKDKKPVEQIMGKMLDRFVPALRETLGDTDESQWAVDKDGKPQDPWQYTNYLIMKMPGIDDPDALFTFTTSSKGGISGISKLCGDYAKLGRMRARGEQPIVKLGIDRWTSKEYGPMKNPDFKIVGWVAPHEFAAALEQEAEQAAADAEARKAIDEDIPF